MDRSSSESKRGSDQAPFIGVAAKWYWQSAEREWQKRTSVERVMGAGMELSEKPEMQKELLRDIERREWGIIPSEVRDPVSSEKLTWTDETQRALNVEIV